MFSVVSGASRSQSVQAGAVIGVVMCGRSIRAPLWDLRCSVGGLQFRRAVVHRHEAEPARWIATDGHDTDPAGAEIGGTSVAGDGQGMTELRKKNAPGPSQGSGAGPAAPGLGLGG